MLSDIDFKTVAETWKAKVQERSPTASAMLVWRMFTVYGYGICITIYYIWYAVYGFVMNVDHIYLSVLQFVSRHMTWSGKNYEILI